MRRGRLDSWEGWTRIPPQYLRDLLVRHLASPDVVGKYPGYYRPLRFGWRHGLIDASQRLTPAGAELARLIARVYRGDLVALEEDNGVKAIKAIHRRLDWLRRQG